ncbi:SusC/RagA family TonB-linked outer membrane protein [Mucilaginibacter sp. HD30]
MKKLLLVSLCVLVLCVTQVFAQNRTITGTVTAKDDGLPIPGVTVKIKGTSTGVPTDANGKYSISAPSGAVLSFSFVAFVTQDVTVGNQSTINVSLVADNALLSEVVVTALGIERQKKDLGYASAVVKNEAINAGSAVNLANGLQGKVSGLNITTTNSGVFENVKINLRGIRSLLGNNNPLLLIDGVQTDISYLSSLNPNDIEDVNVIKGSSGAGIYGSDARNGVIVVTTKKGTRTGTPVVTISNSTQFQSVSFFPKFQNQFGLGGGGNNQNLGGYDQIENWSWGPRYDGSTVDIGPDLSGVVDPIFGPLTTQQIKYSPNDSRTKFFNTATIVQNDVSYSEKNFFLSLQDVINNGIVPKDQNRRSGIRLNVTKEYGRLKIGVNTNYIQNNYNIFDQEGMSDYNTTQNVGLNQGLMNLLFNTNGYVNLQDYKDFNKNPYASYNYYFTNYGLNPYFAVDNWRKEGKKQDLIANLNLDFKVADWLNLTYRGSITTSTLVERRKSQGEAANVFGHDVRGFGLIPGAVQERNYTQQRMSSELFAAFNKQVNEDFKVSAIAGTYIRQDNGRDTRVGASQLTVTDLYNISQRAGELTGSSPMQRSRMFAVYGSAGVGYKGWANVEFTARNEKTSVLAEGLNSYFYPGVNGSIILTDAISGLKNSNTLSYLKLRGGWNKTGNSDVAPYQLAATFSQGGGFPYGSTPGYSADGTVYNSTLRPEFIQSTEAGLEAGFFNSRVNIEFTAFNQKMTDQIIPISISNATGYGQAFVNAAAFTNRGLEMDLKLTPLVDLGQVHVNFAVNATYNESKVTSVYPGLDQVSVGGYTYAGNWAIKDYPAFMFRATDYNRDPATGKVIVSALTGAPTAATNTAIYGQTMPKWIVGLNPSIRWKSLNVSALFEYKGGHQAFADIGNAMSWTGVSDLSATNSRERWVFPNSVYQAVAGGPYIPNTSVTLNNSEGFWTGVGRSVGANYLISASSWRFRELSVSYDLPVAAIFGSTKAVKAISVAVTGRNLALWLPKNNKYQDPDFTFGPSASNFGTGSTTGVQTGNTSGVSNSTINPPVRTIGGNITVTF